MRSGPRKVTDMRAIRRSPFNTARTTRRTAAGDSGDLPCTDTSAATGRLELRLDPAARTRIGDTVVIHPREGPAELVGDPVEVAQGDRRVLELAGLQLLLDQVL